eukprot:4479361-Prymnesium_polylepis.1
MRFAVVRFPNIFTVNVAFHISTRARRVRQTECGAVVASECSRRAFDRTCGLADRRAESMATISLGRDLSDEDSDLTAERHLTSPMSTVQVAQQAMIGAPTSTAQVAQQAMIGAMGGTTSTSSAYPRVRAAPS